MIRRLKICTYIAIKCVIVSCVFSPLLPYTRALYLHSPHLTMHQREGGDRGGTEGVYKTVKKHGCMQNSATSCHNIRYTKPTLFLFFSILYFPLSFSLSPS